MNAVGLIFLVALYFLPTILAVLRKHPSVGAIAVINLFFGWTVIGWILALAKAAGNASRGEIIVQQTMVHHGTAAVPPPAAAMPAADLAGPGVLAEPPTPAPLPGPETL